MAFLDRFKTANYRDGSKWFERDGFFYIAYRHRNNKVYLRCAQTNCKARWIQDRDITSLSKVINQHNHPRTEWMRERNMFFTVLKKRAGMETTPFPTIYAEEARRFPTGAKHLSYNMVDSTMRVARKQAVLTDKTIPVDSPREMHEISIFEDSTPKIKQVRRSVKAKDFNEDGSDNFEDDDEESYNANKCDVRVCRGCLLPTPKLHKLGEASVKMYTTLTGLEISQGDGYPLYFCFECKNFVKKSLEFRRKCRRAFMIMQKFMTKNNQVTFDDIITVNRMKSSLNTNISHNKPKSTAFFTANEYSITQHNVVRPDGTLCIDLTEDNYQSIDNIDEEDSNLEPNKFETNDIDHDDEYDNLDDKTEALVLERKGNHECDRNVVVCTNETALLLSLASIKALSEEEQRSIWAERQDSKSMENSRYSCTMCIKKYDTLELFNKHVEEHVLMSPSIYTCCICDCKFVSQAKLDMHVSHTHLYEYECKACDTPLYTLDDYISHAKRKHPKLRKTPPSRLKLYNELENEFTIESMPPELVDKSTSFRENDGEFVCEMCDIAFKNNDGLSSHSKRHIEPLKKPYRCQCHVCMIWFRNTTDLENHLRDWHMYTYKCNLCTEVMLNKAQALSHKKLHGPSTRSNLSCDICHKTFSSVAGVVFHRYASHYAHIYKSHCVTCGNAFSSRYSLYQHQLVNHGCIAVSDPHSGDPSLYCKSCDVYFAGHASYAAHVMNMNHSEEAKELDFACVPCKKMFDTLQEYETHAVTCSGCDLQYPRKCCYCQERMVSRSRYNQHIRSLHNKLRVGENPDYVLCEWCGKALHKLRISHHKCSSRTLDATCNHCHALLPHGAPYVLHVLAKHSGRPYICAECGVKFARRYECRDHIMKVHAPVRPYICDSCNQDFSHIDDLNAHNKTVHESNMKKVRSNNKYRERFITFPHMKIDVSLLDKDILESVDLELCDYLEKESYVVENKDDYFVTTLSVDSYKVEKGKRSLRSRGEDDDETSGYTRPKRRSRYIKTEFKEEDEEAMIIECITPDRIEEEIVEEEMLEIESADNACEIIIDGSEMLDVIERNGEKYVTIQNVLYKVASE